MRGERGNEKEEEEDEDQAVLSTLAFQSHSCHAGAVQPGLYKSDALVSFLTELEVILKLLYTDRSCRAVFVTFSCVSPLVRDIITPTA